MVTGQNKKKERKKERERGLINGNENENKNTSPIELLMGEFMLPISCFIWLIQITKVTTFVFIYLFIYNNKKNQLKHV